jgi:D-3-phosphoglycerate dehydrogenase / 2-oxoglutarate reductase
VNIVIPDDYQDAVRGLACFRRLAGHHVTVYRDTTADLDELGRRFADADAIVAIRERTRFTAALLDRLPRLALISQTGKIAGHIRLDDCTARGVAVAEGVGSPHAPAELTWALIMAARRFIPRETAAMKAGRWQTTLGQVLRGQTLGIWSYGKIGRLVAGYGRAFGMRVITWGREGSLAAARADGFEAAPSRDALFAESDVVSLHLRLDDDTRGIVGAADLGRMKSTALFVNTSRAELVEPGALVDALRAGRPGYAAVDVYEEEPVLDVAHPLLQMENVICTPHLGYVERESYELYFGAAFSNILAYAEGKPINIANPEALGRPRVTS